MRTTEKTNKQVTLLGVHNTCKGYYENHGKSRLEKTNKQVNLLGVHTTCKGYYENQRKEPS